MKTIAKIIFRIHRKIYKYPTKTEIRLALQDFDYDLDIDWYIGMLYLCGDSINYISRDFEITEEEVKLKLNQLVKDLKL